MNFIKPIVRRPLARARPVEIAFVRDVGSYVCARARACVCVCVCVYLRACMCACAFAPEGINCIQVILNWLNKFVKLYAWTWAL